MDIKRIDFRNTFEHELPEVLTEMQKVISPKCKKLNILGEIKESDINAVAVVGSRKITNYGRRVCKEVVSSLAAAGVTIVSGLMYGADIEAHKAAIAVGGRTIAVLGYGLDSLDEYQYAKDVAKEIISKGCGCIVSEYPDADTAKGWTFPQRNRIVSGLSRCVIIIEAGMKSGSLITAGQALDQGKTVFVVPGSIFNPVSKGSHFLIKQGATLLDDSRDILDYLEISLKDTPVFKKSQKLENEMESKILKLLSREAISVDIEDLCLQLRSTFSDINIALTSLEITGKIRKDILGKWEISV